jgi:hypothetical protein
MFYNSWSVVLFLCSTLALILTARAAGTALRVLRFWNPGSDSNLQIRLENETWLASTLVGYGLGFQICSLVLLVMAADFYSQILAGAMCATGALTANIFGIPALIVKVIGVFFYGFWIVLHRLDIRSESYPLVRMKFGYLLAIMPLLAADIILQVLYVSGLEPDIITSCCAAVFNTAATTGKLPFAFDTDSLLHLHYAGAAGLIISGLVLVRIQRPALIRLYAGGWFLFLPLALATSILVLSSYIYAMPHHNCPFCMFKQEYSHLGIALFGTLLAGSFFGMAGAGVEFLKRRAGLAEIVPLFQRTAIKASLLLMAGYLVFSSYHFVMYRIMGGES